jgi:hypothetical protein
VLGIVQGHGEATLSENWEAKQALDVLHTTQLVNLEDSTLNLDIFNTLAIIGPKDSFPAGQLAKLDAFLMRGGRLFIAINRSDVDLTKEQYSHAVNTGLEGWLSQKGIDVNNNVVIDINCQQGWIQPQPGYILQVTIPYFMILGNFGEHTVSSGLEQVMMNFASSMIFRVIRQLNTHP